MRALTHTSAVFVVGGERIDVASTRPTVARVFDEPTPCLECTLADGSRRLIVRAAVVGYEGDLVERPADNERWWD